MKTICHTPTGLRILPVFLFFLVLHLALPAQNAIVTENALPGNPASEWDVSGSGDPTIQGFATDISVNKGQTIHFKVKTDASAYTLKIYRLGYYQGNGARFIANAVITASLPQTQPADLYDPNTGLVDCGNWNESAHWDVPATAVSGIYIARLERTDNGGASHMVFIVRDDASTSDLYFQTSDATWQAYNVYGGNSLYVGSTTYPSGHATKVSYNRPFITRDGGGGGGPAEDWLFNAEYPMVRWLERNGYDVSYTSEVDADRRGNLILQHKVFLSVGHDEYWSAQQRANVETARDSGVHLAFFSGNEIYWKTRWENTIDGSGTPYRTLVCYKEGDQGENVCGTKCDPLPATWTGLWRDGCDYPAADGCRPENSLSGQISWDGTTGAIEVPDTYKNLRFWRNTSVATLPVGQTATLSQGTLGYEWDWEQYTAFFPAGRIRLSETVLNTHTHHLSLYRAASGALVFGAGTVQWSWGLDGNHDRGSSTEDIRMQQATVNLFADMGVQPATLQAGLVPATASTDVQAPVSVITSPLNGGTLANGVPLTITGTASDNVLVAGVEVSVDGGVTWHAAHGTTNWTFAWTPFTAGPVNIRSRAFDDSGNLETPAAGIIDTVSQASPVVCPCSLFQPADVPVNALENDGQAIELGVKFQSSVSGYITALRFYKGAGTTGLHAGHLWTTTGDLLAEELFASETASGWQEVTLATPVAIDANTTYIASFFSSSGDYPYTDGFFVNAFNHGPLHALADGENGANGVYSYGSEPVFPASTYNSSNYWVDVVFAESTGPDTIAPVVSSTSPVPLATGVGVNSGLTVSFSERIDPSTLGAATFELRDSANALVPATIAYNAALHRATLVPLSPLAYASVYTATVKGGLSYNRIKDLAGNAMVTDYSWSFTTAPVPPPLPTEGPGGPILLISSSQNPFSRYPVEILRAEGFNEFSAMDITAVDATVLSGYQVVILGDISLNAAQVTLLTNWTNAGGTLITFRPDAQLAPLMGITPTGTTLSDQYLLVNTATSPGTGIVNQTIQYHGAADLYQLSGATAVATLYSNATTPTIYPAVTMHNVGTNGGQAYAFTYDLARSVVYTRQGNPAWSGQKRDAESGPIRPDDQFFPDWIDLNKVAIPQADEQQHLLSNMILSGNMDRMPLPRFWFLPKDYKAAIVMTGDNHGDNGMKPRFDLDLAQSTPGCSVDDWECIRSTGYLYVGSSFTDSMANHYDSLGFEVALHVNTNCNNFTASQYEGLISSQLSVFQGTYPSVPAPSTNRNHCIAWSEWSTVPEAEAAHGVRLDVNYYYWPGTWVNNRSGMFTGSGLPMRFAKQDGTLIDCYQAPTQMTDESSISLPSFCDSLLNKATGPQGYYGVFVTNMHFDQFNHPGANAIVASAVAHHVPVITARQLLRWTDARNNSSFGAMSWSGNVLHFTVSADTNARNMRAMLPVNVNGNLLAGVTLNGLPVAYTQEVIKGIEYAFIPAMNGNYEATYSIAPALVITNVSATPNSNVSATITWTTNTTADSRVDYDTSAATFTHNVSNASLTTAHSIVLTGLVAGETYYYRVTSENPSPDSVTEPALPAAPLSFTMPSSYCAKDETFADFSAGTDTNTTVVQLLDGEVTLAPMMEESFNATSTPPAWNDTTWDSQAGAATTYNGATVTVNGTHAYTNAAYGPSGAIEFAAVFTTGNFQNVGYTADVDFNGSWVVIGRGALNDNNVYARTSNNESVLLGTNLLNAQHIYRIERDTTTGSFRFYVDGVLISTPGIALTSTANLLVQISDYPAGGPALSVDWLHILPYAPSGNFTSQIFDNGDTTSWGVVNWIDSLPVGTSLSVMARGGNTPAPDTSWTAFLPLSNGGTTGITSRYLQYKAQLSTTIASNTPVLKFIGFNCSSTITCTAPVAYISAVDPSVCQDEAIRLRLDSAQGAAPYDLVVNGVPYTDVSPGQVFATFQPAVASLWGSSGSPANPNGSDGQPIETGVKFRASVNGFVKGVRFYKGSANTGTHVGSLWTANGTLLASATFTSETASGWQEVQFAAPVYVSANTTYVASYYSAGGTFAITPSYFTSAGFSNGSLTALQAGVDGPNGVYAYGGGFPAGGSNANYWVDVLFTEAAATDSTVNYLLTGVTDNNHCAATGDTLRLISATIHPLPSGSITASSACMGQDVYLTFHAGSGTGPFSIVVNDSTYTGVMNGVPFNSGVQLDPGMLHSLWDTTAVPATLSVNDNQSIEVGVKFRSDTAGKIKGIRFYKGPTNTGTHTGSLWTASGVLLATATFTNETAGGWQEVLFSTPVTIAANTTYIASYHTTTGNYSHNASYFTSSGYTNGHLHALQEGEDGSNGVYHYAPGTAFPDNSFSSSNYWVDPIFTLSDNTFTLTSVTAAGGCGAMAGRGPVSPAPVIPVSVVIAAQQNVKCKTDSTGSAIVQVTGGSGVYSYLWNDSHAQTGDTATGLPAGTYTVRVTDIGGCSDTAWATVIVTEPAAALSVTLTASPVQCHGGADGMAVAAATGGTSPYAYTWSNTIQDDTATSLAAGTLWVTVTDSLNCVRTDSVQIIQPVALASAQAVVLCNGDSLVVGPAVHYATGIYTDTLTAVNGCDSTVTTNLTVHAAITNVQSATICSGDSVVVGIHAYHTSGTYVDVLAAANGCDSVVTTNLTVHPAIVSAQTLSRCYGGSVTVGSHTYTASGVYTDTITAANGCDSIVTTNLTVHPAIVSAQTFSRCYGGSVTVGSHTYTASGVYTDTITAANGCDSIVTTNLTVHPMIVSSQTLSRCYGGSVTVGSHTYTASGVYTDTITAANGCDSIVTTNLTVHPAIVSAQTLSRCYGGSVTVGSHTYTASGIYTDTITAANGCDSIVTTNLTVHPAIISSQTLTRCYGGSVTVGSHTHTTSGIYTDTITAVNGCDSVVITQLTVLPANAHAQAVTLCYGTGITIGVHTYYAAGTYTDTLAAVNGCDSTITTTIAVLSPISSMQWLTACYGGSVSVGNHTYTVSGTYLDTLAAASGCDSIVTTNLVVAGLISNSVTAHICDNDSLLAGGTWQHTSGVYTDTLVSAGGCDSIRITTLTVTPGFTVAQAATICRLDSIWLGGGWQHTAGVYYDTLSSQSGCDSVLVTTLSLNAVDTSVTDYGDTLVAHAGGTTFQWIDCSTGQPINGATDSIFIPVSSGVYAVIVTENGCSDTSSCFNVVVSGTHEANAPGQLTVYPNPVQDVLTVLIAGEPKSAVRCRVFNAIGEQLVNNTYENTATITLDFSGYEAGTYFVEISGGNGASIVKVIKY